MLEPGQTAPDFSIPDDTDTAVTLSELRPKAVVLYFYPKADTSGCTKQAIGFTEHLAAFEAAGAVILGVSRDPVKKLAKFRDKHELKVTLLSDEDGSVCEDYGVWVEKSMYGKKYMGIERSTFLIAGDGSLHQVWRKVKVPGHVEAVLEAAKSL